MNARKDFLDEVVKVINGRKSDRAPLKITENIHACLENIDTNNARLLRASPPAWTLVRFAIDHEKSIGALLEQVDPSHISGIVSRLSAHESCSKIFQHTFQEAQRGKKRQAALDKYITSFSIPSESRPYKQPRLDPPPSSMSSDEASSSDLQTTGHQSSVSASLVPIETHQTIDSTTAPSNHGTLPDAAVLPLVFPQRMCDGVFKYTEGKKEEAKYKVFACVTLSWQDDASQCSLDIGLTTTGASTVAGEIFQKRISYNEDKAVWVLTFDDGVEASMRPGDTFDRARDLPMKPLLGELVSTIFENNPQRHRELKEGDRMTRLLSLTLGDSHSPSKLRVILEAEMLKGLGRHLWPQY